MYRSRSTSSVYFDAIHNSSDGPSWSTAATDPPEHRHSEPNGGTAGPRLSLVVHRPKESPLMNQNTLTSALTGSKMATSSGIPTGAGGRPLPKALLPKSARTPITPSPMYGSSLGLNSPSAVKRDNNFSGSMTPTAAKSPALFPEQRVGVQRMESSPMGATFPSPKVHPNEPRATESARWNNTLPRPHTAGLYPQGSSLQRPIGVGADASGRDSRVSHPLAWNTVNATPIRRREAAIVQDSIVPILKAALGKDNDPQDRRIQKEEETVNRQVFGRTAKGGGGGLGTLRTVSMYASTDDVFGGRSSSYDVQQPPSSSGYTTLPRGVHLKSHSEVLPPRGFEDLQRRAMRNSMSTAVSTSDIYGRNAPGVQEIAQREFRSQDHPPTLPSSGPPHPHPTSRQLSSHGFRLTSADPSSWNSRSTSSFVHSNGTSPSPAHTPSWEATPPPLSAPPIPSHSTNHPSTERPYLDMDSHRVSWFDPIPVQPRKVIMSPSVVLDSPRNLVDTQRSSRSLVFFGESFSPSSYPLLAKVETDTVDGDLDSIVTTRNAWNVGTANLTAAAVSWKEHSGKMTGNGFSSTSPAATISSVHPRTSTLDNITVPSPPIEFRDDPSTLSHPISTSSAGTVPPLPITHQATDSMNTEDSGLERWEKDGNDHSADEQDTPSGHVTSASSTGDGSSSSLRKRGSSSWREDATSEGRGSLSSSPRPQNSDENSASPTDDPYLTIANSGRFVDDKAVPSNSILRQLLAENVRQTTARNQDERTTTPHSHGSERREMRSMVGHSESVDSEPPPPLPPSAPPPLDLDSDGNGGIDSDSCHSHSTAVQSTVTVFENIAEPPGGDRSRSTEYAQRNNGEDARRGSEEEGALWRDRSAGAYLDHSDASTRLPSFREIHVSSSQRSAFEATKYGNERLHSESGGSGGAEEDVEIMDGEGLMVVEIVKGPVGVGFCIEGGKGSLSGDRPIAVKRVFKGGSSDGTVNLRPGDELLSIGGQSLDGLSHYEAWKSIKSLPNGTFPLAIRRKTLINPSSPQLP